MSYGGGAPPVDCNCSAEMIVPSQVALPSRSAGLPFEDLLPLDWAEVFMTPVPVCEDLPGEIPKACHQLITAGRQR